PPATNDGANGNPMRSTPGGGSVGGDSPATAGTGGTNGQDSANNSSTQGPTGELVVDGEIIVLGENSNVPVGCGNGVLTPDEACDDGNEQSGDGCDAECLQVEPGFSCAVPGQACREIARCGDGL